MIKIGGCPNCKTTFKQTYEMEDSDEQHFVFCMYCKKGFLVSKYESSTFYSKIAFDPFKDLLK